MHMVASGCVHSSRRVAVFAKFNQTTAGVPMIASDIADTPAQPPDRLRMRLAHLHRALAMGARMFELPGLEEGLDSRLTIRALHVLTRGVSPEATFLVVGWNLHV